jgi:SPP1 family predicted phage head-tail adaptor
MRAGRLRHRIIIQKFTAGQDVYGAEVLTWSTLATVWAEVRSTGGREQVQPDEQVFATRTHEVTIRRLAQRLTPKMRVLWSGRILEITDVREPDNRLRMLQLVCTEIIDGTT